MPPTKRDIQNTKRALDLDLGAVCGSASTLSYQGQNLVVNPNLGSVGRAGSESLLMRESWSVWRIRVSKSWFRRIMSSLTSNLELMQSFGSTSGWSQGMWIFVGWLCVTADLGFWTVLIRAGIVLQMMRGRRVNRGSVKLMKNIKSANHARGLSNAVFFGISPAKL